MSQSSQESENLLSPPPEPVAIVRGAHGLLAVDGEPNASSEAIANRADSARNNVCRLSDTFERSRRGSDKFDSSLNQRVSTEAQFTSARRRRRTEKSPGDESSESNADIRREVGADTAEKEATVPKWRTFTKSYRTAADAKTSTSYVQNKSSNVLKYFVGNKKRSPNSSEHNSLEKSTRKSNEGSPRQQTKRTSDEIKETYMPFAKTRRSKENVNTTSDNIEYAKLIMREIEVPEEGQMSVGYGHAVMSQLTMDGGTQAYFSGGAYDEDSGEESDGGPDAVKEANAEMEDQEGDLATDTSACKLSTHRLAGGEKLDESEDDESAQSRQESVARKQSEYIDVFEFEPSQEQVKAKPLPPAVAAAAKKRKKGPTDMALLEESNYDSSQKSSQNNILVVENKNSVDFDEAPDFEPIAEEADEESPQQNGASPVPESSKQTKHETSLTNYNQIENMCKALACPICCHSLKSSTFLPCGHAFCHDCLSDALRNSGSNASCPICRLKCTRRSGSRNQQLDEIVNGFKGVMRAFAFAPLVHSNNVGMTQLSPGEDCWGGDEEGSGGRTSWGAKKRRIGMDEALEHQQVAQSNLEAFSSFQKQHAPPPPVAAQNSSGTRLTKEELERLNMTRRYQLLAADQAAVMQADQEALEKVTKKKQMVADATKEFANVDNNNEDEESIEEDVAVDTTSKDQVQVESADIEEDDDEEDRKMPAAMAPEESQDTFYTVMKSNNGVEGKKELFSVAKPPLPPIESQDTFHTAESEYSKEANQYARASIETAQSPTVLHDGNTAKKERLADSEKEVPDNRQSWATVASTVVLHDGNTAQKKAEVDRTPRRSGRHLPFLDDDNEQASNDEVEFAASPHSLGVDDKSAQKPQSDANKTTSTLKRTIEVGSVVIVQPRTWPGINKHGGVGRVTKIDSSGSSKKYDVAYVLGGKEKGVDEIYVSLNEAEQSQNADLTVGARVSRSAEKAPRPTRKRSVKVKKSESFNSIPVFNDEELQQIPADVLEWAGISRPKGKACEKAMKSKSAKKRVLAESSGNVASKKSKMSKANKNTPTSDHDGGRGKSLSFEDAINQISKEELMRYADERYSSLISSNDDKAFTIHAVTSSLSDKDTKLLTSLTKTLKSNNITLKIMKDFKAGKTQLCLTSAAPDSTNEQNIVSKSRTLKIMRSALFALPILTPQWMECCMKESRVVKPTSSMCIRSLPRKTPSVDDDSLASFGVAKYAAAASRTDSKVLSKCSVLLCGKWKSSGQTIMKDLKILLEDAGATLMNSASSALQLLAEESAERVVLLCDDSHIDADCGVSDSLYRKAKRAIAEDQSKVLTVHFQWLFDCVSCAKFMSGKAYEPTAPRTKELWRLNCESED